MWLIRAAADRRKLFQASRSASDRVFHTLSADGLAVTPPLLHVQYQDGGFPSRRRLHVQPPVGGSRLRPDRWDSRNEIGGGGASGGSAGGKAGERAHRRGNLRTVRVAHPPCGYSVCFQQSDTRTRARRFWVSSARAVTGDRNGAATTTTARRAIVILTVSPADGGVSPSTERQPLRQGSSTRRGRPGSVCRRRRRIAPPCSSPGPS